MVLQGKPVTYYGIHVWSESKEWRVYRRFKQFALLNDWVKKSSANVATKDMLIKMFPRKTWQVRQQSTVACDLWVHFDRLRRLQA